MCAQVPVCCLMGNGLRNTCVVMCCIHRHAAGQCTGSGRLRYALMPHIDQQPTGIEHWGPCTAYQQEWAWHVGVAATWASAKAVDWVVQMWGVWGFD